MPLYENYGLKKKSLLNQRVQPRTSWQAYSDEVEAVNERQRKAAAAFYAQDRKSTHSLKLLKRGVFLLIVAGLLGYAIFWVK